jgi:hypothetical protein
MPLQGHLGALERHAAAARTLLPALWAVLVAANLTLLRATWTPAQPARPPAVHRRELRLTLLCSLGLGLPCLVLASRIVEPAPYLMLAGGPVVYELALAALGLSLLLEQGLAAWLGWRFTVPGRQTPGPPLSAVPPAPPASLAPPAPSPRAPAAPAPPAAAGSRPSGRNLLTMALITLCGCGVTGSPILGGGTMLLAAAGCWALARRGQLRPAGPRAGRVGAPAPVPAPPPLDAAPALDRTSGNPDGATRWSVPHA